MRANGRQLGTYRPLIEKEKIIPLVGEIIDFSEIPQALENISRGKSKPGKTVAKITGAH